MEKEINNNGFDYVDLELPSGTLWATCNVGADKPSNYGLYFQWGDTNGYTIEQVGKDKQFTWTNYKWNPSGDGKTFTKYKTLGDTLDLEDDAAHIHMDGSWHIPTPKQIQELIDNTTSNFETVDGIRGMKFISKKDCSKFIFIPAAGIAYEKSVHNSGCTGTIWSSMLSESYVGNGQYLYLNPVYLLLIGNCSRFNGRSVRGVIG